MPGHKGTSGGEYGFDMELVAEMMRAGFQVGVHAIGDAGNRESLDFLSIATLMPNLMYRNRGGTGFADVTMGGGFGNLQKGNRVVLADLDRDGDQDIFEKMEGALAGDSYCDSLYRNPGFGNRWLTVELTGVQSNHRESGRA
jgi:hypothetical protein